MPGEKVFEKHKVLIALINNGGKIALGLLSFVLLVALINNASTTYLLRLLNIALVFSIVIILMGQVIKRFIHCIKFNFEESTIEILAYRTPRSIAKRLDEVKTKKLLGYLVLYIDDKLFIYNGKITQDLDECLSKLTY